jgi:hypothetical protein
LCDGAVASDRRTNTQRDGERPDSSDVPPVTGRNGRMSHVASIADTNVG